MAVLVGKSSFAGTYTQIAASELRYHYLGYTATAGTLTSLRLRCIRDGDNTANNVRMGIYNSSGNLVVESGSTAVSSNASAQTIVCTVTGTALSAATYYIAFVADGTIDLDAGATAWQNDGAAHAYGALPASISVPPGDNLALGEVAAWGESTDGGGSIVPQAMASYRQQ